MFIFRENNDHESALFSIAGYHFDINNFFFFILHDSIFLISNLNIHPNRDSPGVPLARPLLPRRGGRAGGPAIRGDTGRLLRARGHQGRAGPAHHPGLGPRPPLCPTGRRSPGRVGGERSERGVYVKPGRRARYAEC